MGDGGGRVAKQVRVTGRVQAVTFRASAVDRAEELGVAGWVRNEPDGSVVAHVEGPPDAVEDMLSWMHQGPRPADVNDVEARDTEVTGDGRFRVAF